MRKISISISIAALLFLSSCYNSTVNPSLVLDCGTETGRTPPYLPNKEFLKDRLAQIDCTAEQVTVLIKRINSDGKEIANGSGVLIAHDKTKNIYYVLTADDVVKDQSLKYRIITPDGRSYWIDNINITRKDAMNLAVIQFTSYAIYPTATLASYNPYKPKNTSLFISGFPVSKEKNQPPTRLLTAGNLISNLKTPDPRLLEIDRQGYGLIYSNLTPNGMSGGPILDNKGRVIGIHVMGDSLTPNLNEGYGLGVPIRNFLALSDRLGLDRSLLKVKLEVPPELTKTEQDNLKTTLLKPLERPPRDNSTPEEQLNYANFMWRLKKDDNAMTGIDYALRLNPSYAPAVYLRGLMLKEKGQFQEASAAFEQVIKWQPDNLAAQREYILSLAYQQQWDEALTNLDKILDQKAKNPTKDPILYWLKGYLLSKLDQDQKAINAYTAAIELEPHPYSYKSRGLVRYRLADNRGAIADYTKAIELNPKDLEAFLNRGLVRYNMGDNKGATIDFTKAINLNPSDTQAYVNRGLARIALGNKEGGLADFSKVIELDPDNPEGYYNRGIIRLTNLSDPEGALEDYNEAIKLKPSSPAGYFGRALVYYNMSNKEKALADYNKAIERDPKYALAYNNRGLLYRDLDKNEAALADFSKAIDLNPQDALSYYNRGLLQYSLGENQAALDDFSKVIELNPRLADAYYNRGLVHQKLNNTSDALKDYNSAIAINPQYADAYNNRGLIKAASNDIQGAIIDYTRAIELNPQYSEAYNNRGLARYNLNDNQGALADYTKAIELQPQDANIYVNRGLLRYNLGDNKGTIDDFSKAIELKPKDADTYYNRGLVFYNLGDSKNALLDYNQAISINRDLWRARLNIGLILYEIGSRDEALLQLQEAARISGTEPEPQMALAVALYTKGEGSQSLLLAEQVLKSNKELADLAFLKKSRWGDRLRSDTQKLLDNPTIQPLLR